MAKLNDDRGTLAGALIVDEGDEVLVVLASGKVVRSAVAEVPAKGRDTMGVVFARFAESDRIIALANQSAYGLQASVWTRSLDRAHRVSRALRAGTVHVNQYDEDDITVPFGGFKQSGNGRDKSLHAFDKYTELKTTWLRLDAG